MDKKHIIDEIIRTAKENNGIPLGIGKFARVTGIKRRDWCGKYWTKWGDAIKEAGYEPNKMISAYDENLLIERIVSLIREKRKFPTADEIRLKAHQTKGFPAYSTFRRLGKKFSIIAQVILDTKTLLKFVKLLLLLRKKRKEMLILKRLNHDLASYT